MAFNLFGTNPDVSRENKRLQEQIRKLQADLNKEKPEGLPTVDAQPFIDVGEAATKNALNVYRGAANITEPIARETAKINQEYGLENANNASRLQRNLLSQVGNLEYGSAGSKYDALARLQENAIVDGRRNTDAVIDYNEKVMDNFKPTGFERLLPLVGSLAQVVSAFV